MKYKHFLNYKNVGIPPHKSKAMAFVYIFFVIG